MLSPEVITLVNRVSLVEQEQKHTREILEARIAGLTEQFRNFESGLIQFDTKLDRITQMINTVSADPMATAASRSIVDDIHDLRAEQALNSGFRKETTGVLSVIRWVGAPGLLVVVIGTVYAFGKVNHLW